MDAAAAERSVMMVSGTARVESPVTDARHTCAIGVVGGSTTIIGYGHIRLVSGEPGDDRR